MFNVLRAEWYRLFRSKGFWWNQAIFVTFIVVTGIGEERLRMSAGEQELGGKAIRLTGFDSLVGATNMGPILVFFLLALFVIIMGTDLVKQSYKNSLTVGLSRHRYFLSKLVSFTIVVIVQIFLYYGIIFLLSSLVNGIGTGFDRAFFSRFFKVAVVQLIFILAIFAWALPILYQYKSNSAAIVTVIVFPLVLTVLAQLFHAIPLLRELDFMGSISRLEISTLAEKGLWRNIVAAILVIVGSSVGTNYRFKKMDL